MGKTKAKADNFTDTSFKAKCMSYATTFSWLLHIIDLEAHLTNYLAITLTQQSLSLEAKSSVAQFTHYLSLASTSKSDTQRRDALSYLTTTLASQPVSTPLPISTAILLPKLLPLILDGTASVRKQLIKLLQQLPADEVKDHVEIALLYIRAGMTHLAAEIRDDAMAVLEWMLSCAPLATVECAGGWVKTLKAFMSMMGWAVSSEKTKWSSATKASFGKGGKTFPKQVTVLALFLRAGLCNDGDQDVHQRGKFFPLWDVEAHVIPMARNPYAYLNLFGVVRDEESEMYTEREARQRVFARVFQQSVEKGVLASKQEAGEVGRAASILSKILKEGMDSYTGVDF